jgi:hypothetical protein
MNSNTSNQTATLEPLTKTTKVSRLHQGVDLSGKTLKSYLPKPPKNSPITINKYLISNKKAALSSRTRKSSLNDSIFTKLNQPQIKFTNLESITFDRDKPLIKVRKSSRSSTDPSSNPSTNNSYINTTQSPASPANNSPKGLSKGSNFQKRNEKTRLPARFLSVNDRSKYMKTKNFPSFDLKDKDQDLVKSIVENDKIHFRLELVFRENRQHKLVEKYSKLEDTWEWSSYGSMSPEKKVRFVDNC